jgi:DNA repair exonuclease SbcCD ATPase subunit
MIRFKTIKYKNFLSTGDDFIEVQLNRAPLTLITGTNGSGKSSLLDALSFALFGKPHRDINKPQLVNSINKKGCLVEVTFSIGEYEYLIRRGIKPTIFEIWQNDVMLNQESHNKDYQKVLEQNILKLNHKSFHQIVVLGSSSFTPFMQLPTFHRREVIEDLLDIGVFTRMNQVLKEDSSKLRDQLRDVENLITVMTEKCKLQASHITQLLKLEESDKLKSNARIEELRSSIQTLQIENEELTNQIDAQVASSLILSQREKETLHSAITTKEAEIKRIVKEVKFFEKNNDCPTCSQPINDDIRKAKIRHYRSEAKGISIQYDVLKSQLSTVLEEVDKLSSKVEELRSLQNKIRSNSAMIAKLQQDISSLLAASSNVDKDHLEKAKNSLHSLREDREKKLALKNDLYNQSVYNAAIAEMLKDSGIKTKIVKQYLPLMNKLVNDYLRTLDFYISFHLDENFNETLKSRHRDEFTYPSFSEGEKQRIDLALLFTWRQIARMKNSVSTNLLVLDETFDSSLDTEGIENLLKIIRGAKDGENIFIISHKIESLENISGEHYRFEKIKNFSRISQIS